jgi:hypothetical protein
MLFLKWLRKKFRPMNFQRIVEVFTQKIFNMLSNIWVWDPGSEIRDPEKSYYRSRIPDPGVKKAPDPVSGSATLFPSQCNPKTGKEKIKQWSKFGLVAIQKFSLDQSIFLFVIYLVTLSLLSFCIKIGEVRYRYRYYKFGRSWLMKKFLIFK